MFKYLYNVFLISILCISVLMLDISLRNQSLQFGIMRADAQTQTQTQPQTLTTGTSASSGFMSGVLGPDEPELKTSLIIAAICILTLNMPLLYGKSGIDIILGGIGALLFIVGSITDTNDLKKAMKEISIKIERKDNNELTDTQKQSLINLRDSYNKAKNSAKNKKDLQDAAVMAYMLAAVTATVMAIFLSYVETASSGGCTAYLQGKVMSIELGRPARFVAFTAAVALMGVTAPSLVAAAFYFHEAMEKVVRNVMCFTAARVVTWTVFSMFAQQASQDTQKQITKLDEDVMNINSVLTTIAQQANGNSIETANASSASANNPINAAIPTNGQTVTSQNADVVQFPCVNQTQAGGVCPNLVSLYNAQPQASGLPTNIGTQIGNMVRLGSAYSGSNTANANLPSSSGAIGNSAAIKAFLGKQKELLQKKLLENGNTYNLAKEEAKLYKSMNDTADKAIKEKMSPAEISAVMSSFGSKNDHALNDKLGINKLAAIGPNVLKSNGLNSNLGVSAIGKSNAKIGEIKLEENANANNVAKVEEKVGPKSMDDFDLKNEINSDKGPSIFEIISSRYQKSAYPRIFQRIEE